MQNTYTTFMQVNMFNIQINCYIPDNDNIKLMYI